MEITVLGWVIPNRNGAYVLPYTVSGQHDTVLLNSDLEGATGSDQGCALPHCLERFSDRARSVWMFRSMIIQTRPGVGPYEPASLQEKQLEIMNAVLNREDHFERLAATIERRLKGESDEHRREALPESVRLFVWQRDQGMCVYCGSRELLEFDHIIPVSEGGSNTERNIQLLCEPCNRKKGKRI